MIYEHTGLTVSNLERSIVFYTDVFGFCLLRKTSTSAYLHLGNDLLELTQSIALSTENRTHEINEVPTYRMNNSIGISHIGFRVDDLDDTIEKIEKLGGKLVIPPFNFVPRITYVADQEDEKLKRASIPNNINRSWRIAGFSDPDGIILEIIER